MTLLRLGGEGKKLTILCILLLCVANFVKFWHQKLTEEAYHRFSSNRTNVTKHVTHRELLKKPHVVCGPCGCELLALKHRRRIVQNRNVTQYRERLGKHIQIKISFTKDHLKNDLLFILRKEFFFGCHLL